MVKLFPNRYTQVPRGDGLAICDEHGLAGRSLRIQEIGHGKHMCVCDIVNVDEILQVGTVAEDIRCLAVGYA